MVQTPQPQRCSKCLVPLTNIDLVVGRCTQCDTPVAAPLDIAEMLTVALARERYRARVARKALAEQRRKQPRVTRVRNVSHSGTLRVWKTYSVLE